MKILVEGLKGKYCLHCGLAKYVETSFNNDGDSIVTLPVTVLICPKCWDIRNRYDG